MSRLNKERKNHMLEKNNYYGSQQMGGGQFHLKTPNFKKIKMAGIGVVVGALLRLRIPHLKAILHTEVVFLLLRIFARRVEERVVRRLQVRLTTHFLRLSDHRYTTHNKYI